MATTSVERGVDDGTGRTDPAVRHPARHRRRDDVAPPRSMEIEARLRVRRAQILRLRRVLFACDAVVTLVVATAALIGGHRLAATVSLGVLVVVTARVFGADGPRAISSTRSVLRATAQVTALACIVVALSAGRSEGVDVLRAALLTGVPLLVVRAMVRVPWLARRLGFGMRRRVVVGDPPSLETNAARRAPLVQAGKVILVVTRAERSAEPETESGMPHEKRRDQDAHGGPHGLVERVVRTALDNRVDRVTVIPGESWQPVQLQQLSWLLEDTGIDMVIATNLSGIAPHRARVVSQDGRLNVLVHSASPRGSRAVAKETLDRAGAAVLLLLSSPLLLLVCLTIRLESRGPAIFRQTRVREGGDTFTMWKFRTMHVAAESRLEELRSQNMLGGDGPLFKMKNDPRITRVGAVLRKTSVDELPQLVNVLRGEMSLIGPRPALPLEVEAYDFVARRRLAVKPGMTGLWQVSGRSRLSWDESIGFDLEYVDNWSPAADAAIVVKTFKAVVTKDGAF